MNTPMLMQLTDPEYMCTKCHAKFYLKDWDTFKNKKELPTQCKYCNDTFDWESAKGWK